MVNGKEWLQGERYRRYINRAVREVSFICQALSGWTMVARQEESMGAGHLTGAA